MPDLVQPQSRFFPAFVVPLAPSTIVFVLDTFPLVNGTIGHVFMQIGAVDTSNGEMSNTAIIAGFRVVANALAPITNNLNDKRTSGGANQFAADVNFVVAPTGVGGQLAVIAGNAVAQRTGNIMATWYLNKGIFP